MNLTPLLMGLLVATGASAREGGASDGNESHACYTACTVRLRGILKYEMSYGSPGFGDTPERDAKVRIPVLVLQRPISVEASGDFLPASDQTEVQIETERDLRAMSGREIEVSGTLRGAVTATDVTGIVLMLETARIGWGE